MLSAICSYFLLGGKMSAFWLFLGLDGYPSPLIFPTLDGSADASLVGQLLCFHKFVTVSGFPTLKYTSLIPLCRASPISDGLAAKKDCRFDPFGSHCHHLASQHRFCALCLLDLQQRFSLLNQAKVSTQKSARPHFTTVRESPASKKQVGRGVAI